MFAITSGRGHWLAAIALLAAWASPAYAQLKVATDFESGSATVLALDAPRQTIRITPAGDSKEGLPCWWYLRVDGVDPTKPLVVQVAVDLPGGPENAKTMDPLALPARAAVSTDGKKWDQTAAGDKKEKQMDYKIPAGPRTVWIAWGPPFTPKDAQDFVDQTAKDHPFAKALTLCKSRGGRAIPYLQIAEGDKPAAQRPAVWVSARQHAWECGGSWVGVGLARWLVGDDQQAQWLRQNAEIFFVPLMDVDHVAAGQGGKGAQPQDQNRDWTGKPYWPEVAASQERIGQLAKQERMSVFLDLHNPGPGSKVPEIYLIEEDDLINPKALPRQEQFFTLLKNELGEVRRMPAEKPKNEAQRLAWRALSTSWVSLNSNPLTLALTIETPWDTPKGTTEGYRDVGEKVGRAVEKLLHDPKP